MISCNLFLTSPRQKLLYQRQQQSHSSNRSNFLLVSIATATATATAGAGDWIAGVCIADLVGQVCSSVAGSIQGIGSHILCLLKQTLALLLSSTDVLTHGLAGVVGSVLGLLADVVCGL